MIHLRSVFLGLISLFNMFMTVPITLIIYKKVLLVSYFSSIHLSVVIIIVGIGCDDIFIFHECWQKARTIPYLKNDLVARHSYIFR